jgi:hypothetical protein
LLHRDCGGKAVDHSGTEPPRLQSFAGEFEGPIPREVSHEDCRSRKDLFLSLGRAERAALVGCHSGAD